ncbi:MAG: hypothetical protein IT577_23215 [Verrucomicrobiae bacterium]|nr:hypothetical protein [Verrucomicrobiae bacterium]
MWLQPIEVVCHAGFRADEEPRRFLWHDRWIAIIEILDRWHQVQGLPEWPRADYFKVAGGDGLTHLIKHDLESDEWFIGLKSEHPESP